MNFDTPASSSKKNMDVIPPGKLKWEGGRLVEDRRAPKAVTGEAPVSAERSMSIPDRVHASMREVRDSIASESATIEKAKGGKFVLYGKGSEARALDAVRTSESNIKAHEERLVGLALLKERFGKEPDPNALAERLADEIANLQKNLEFFQDRNDDATSVKIASELRQYRTAKHELDRMLQEAKH